MRVKPDEEEMEPDEEEIEPEEEGEHGCRSHWRRSQRNRRVISVMRISR